MTLILNGTDSSATTPALTGGTAGTSTGPYFPTTNQWAVATNGTQAMLVDASQNVGIGTSSPGYNLQVNSAASTVVAVSSSNTASYPAFRLSNTGTSGRAFQLGLGGSTSAYPGQFYIYDETAAAVRMLFDTSGNVGIGITSPNAKLEIKAASASQRQLQLTHFNSTDGWYFTADDTGGVLKTSRAGSSGLNGEAMRIDSSGNVLVGTTSQFTGYTTNTRLTVSMPSGSSGTTWEHADSSGGSAPALFNFLNNSNTRVGYIASSGTATSFSTSSDYRLKKDIVPMTNALAKVAALKPVFYKWKEDGSDGEGFIAHELAEVCPLAVNGAKDAVDADGNPQYQGVDTSFLVATLTAAIQELKAEFDAYKATHP
jgi:hypothetical protein